MIRISIGVYILMSLVAFIAFALDKRAAGRGGRRTPEKVLHGLELLGGWPGAVGAVHFLRHKSAKLRFKLIQWAIVTLHVSAWIAYFVLR